MRPADRQPGGRAHRRTDADSSGFGGLLDIRGDREALPIEHVVDDCSGLQAEAGDMRDRRLLASATVSNGSGNWYISGSSSSPALFTGGVVISTV